MKPGAKSEKGPLEFWREVKDAFDAVWEFEPQARLAALDDLCPEEDVRKEVRQMLIALNLAGDFLEKPLIIDPAAINPDEHVGRRIGAYQLIREIGRGGMGTVYLARRADDAFQGEVAVKLITPALNVGEIGWRFKRERHILAQLNHPNIARLLDGGKTEDGWPYLVMEYIPGLPITEYCDRHKLSINKRLALFRKVCDAVEHAHRRLVIHRDIKPGNIFVTEEGEVKLLDFGIAKLIKPADYGITLHLTRSGVHLMTPEYASPEQVLGGEITETSDIYSLGVVMYELLTGHRPHRFRSHALGEIVRVMREEDPAPPSATVNHIRKERLPEGEQQITNDSVSSATTRSTTPAQLRKRLRGDLDQIALKALHKDAGQRYQSVKELSDDLSRHLTRLPVKAHSYTLRYRAAKFLRRHKEGFFIGAFLAPALILSLVFGLYAVWSSRKREQLQQQQVYPVNLRQAREDLLAGNLPHYEAILQRYIPKGSEGDLRGFEWYYLWWLGHREEFALSHDQPFTGGFPVFLDDKLVTGTTTGTIRMWNRETGEKIAEREFAHTPSGAILNDREILIALVENDRTVKLVDLLTGQTRRSIADTSSKITTVRFYDGSGEEAALGYEDGRVMLWETESGRLSELLRTLHGQISYVAINIAHRRLLTITDRHVAQLWNIDSRRAMLTLEGATFEKAKLSGDKWLIVTNAGDANVVYDIATGRKLATIIEPGNKFLTSEIIGEGQGPLYFATCGTDKTVKLYDLPNFRRIAMLVGHDGPARDIKLSPDGRLLATAGLDRTIRLWEKTTWRELAIVRAHASEFYLAGFSNDGRKQISVSADATIKVWDIAALLEPEIIRAGSGKLHSVAFAADNRTLAAAGEDGTIKLWDAQTGAWTKTLNGHIGKALSVSFSPSGRRLVSSGEDHTARIWDVATGENLFTLNHQEQIHSVAFSRDGRILATGSDDLKVNLWDDATGRELRIFIGHNKGVWAVGLSPDGRTLASGSFDGVVKLWDVPSGRLIASFQAHAEAIRTTIFSPDGKLLATASMDRSVKLWDVRARKEIHTFRGHTDQVFEAAFSPDAKRLATASNDHTVKLWDVETGQELLSLKGHTDAVWSATFSPDGKMLASGSWDGTLRLWRTANENRVKSLIRR